MKQTMKIRCLIIFLLLCRMAFRFSLLIQYDILLNKLNQNFFVNILQILAIFIGFIGTGLGILLQERNNSTIKSIEAAGLKDSLIDAYKLPLYLSFFGILFSLFLILFEGGIDCPKINSGITINDLKMFFLLLFILIISSYYRGIKLLFQVIRK